VITVPVLVSGHRISRLEGGAFVVTYLVYLLWLIVPAGVARSSQG
jgi:hypothetical protein